MSPYPTFIAPTLPFLQTRPPRNSSSVNPLHPRTPLPSDRSARIIRAAATKEDPKTRDSDKTKESGKKRAPIVFAKDLKGNFVWTLRGATADDVDAITALFKQIYTRELVATFVEYSVGCLTVCEASVKGTKEGEGYSGRVMGAVMLDVSTVLKNIDKGLEGGTKLTAELFATAVHPELPDRENIRTKLVLGSLKKLKQAGVVTASIDIAEKNEAAIEFFADCLFKRKGKEDGRVYMQCDLPRENPEPQKKVM